MQAALALPQVRGDNAADTLDRVLHLAQQEQYSDAVALAEQGLAAVRTVPGDPALTLFLNETAILYSQLGQTGKAESLFVEEIRLLQKNGPSEQLVDSLQNLALLFGSDGRHLEYVNTMRVAVATYEQLTPKDLLRLIQLQNNLGAACLQLGLHPMALIAFKHCVQTRIGARRSREYRSAIARKIIHIGTVNISL
jgi:hypothetical protein